ncbi:MAG: hypothetical protein ACTSYI_06480 [Promethearchaeota archaeon]
MTRKKQWLEGKEPIIRIPFLHFSRVPLRHKEVIYHTTPNSTFL